MGSWQRKALIALFYPFTLLMIVAGFTAFVLLVFDFSTFFAATVALCFFSFSATILYLIFRPVIKLLNVRRIFLGLVVAADVLAILSLGTLLLRGIV
ncbi:hypothetical protein AKJ44_01235 [candidate division MSBL1 archaeon SCGC-AAA261F17]|uniref:Uncharacterized protein n=1 Tax=candidate division MSBL1 archaeon SCGC-AAA261F17 TaxID=1698274 RepID=A0A133V6Y5_9EURY|nr:hypothetical protein AKJ44_01235 [candidate division MSBL1 archaeon SCGC-AAA261F17]